MKIYIPSNLELEKFLQKNDLKNRDKYYYIIHKIYEEKIFDKSYNKDSYVSLNAKVLESIIVRYKPILDTLIKYEVIEQDNWYIVGAKSKGFRLTEKYRNNKHKAIELTNQKILYRICRYKQKMIDNIPEGVEYSLLYENLQKITIDSTNAINFTYSNYSNDEYAKIYNLISIEKLRSKDFFFKVDNTAGRVHTNITNLDSNLRPSLRFDDKKFINIDISNSQPFLFNLLIKEYFNETNIFIKPIYINFILSYSSFSFYNYLLFIYNNININSINNINNNKYYIYNYLFTIYNLSYVRKYYDVMLYEKLTCEGKFYEYLMDKFEVKAQERRKFKRDVFKRIFFSRIPKKREYVYWKKFKKLFPTVSSIILFYKQTDYKNLAVQLQKSEADIMINKIVKRIAIEKPECFILTIHDSILTTKDNKEYINKVILEEFGNSFNLKPSLKTEILYSL